LQQIEKVINEDDFYPYKEHK